MEDLKAIWKQYKIIFGRQKTKESILRESEAKTLQPVLGAIEVTAIGLGEIIGAGIFVLTGVAAKLAAGPAVIFSFIFSGVACIFSALCYAEFATRVPISGSAYTYAYTVAGEFVAWIIGWDLTLEYTVAAATVARGWSGYLVTFFQGFGVQLPAGLTSLDIGISHADPTAGLLIILLTVLLAIGVKDSSRFNFVLVVCTMLVIFLVLFAGVFYVDTNNWSPFLPFGVNGIFTGASLVFFSYVGFDSVTTLAEEMKNPKKDLPIGIIGSLVASLVLYTAVASILTLMVSYDQIDTDSPIASAFDNLGLGWIKVIISIGAFAALTTTLLNSMLGQSRIYYSMARDGLLWPWIAEVHPRFKTPFNAQIITGLLALILALLFPIESLAETVSIGTLLAFTIVCISVLCIRYTYGGNPQRVIQLVVAVTGLGLFTSFSIANGWHIAVSITFGFITLAVTGLFYFLEPSGDVDASFLCPFMPFTPILGIYSNVFMMANLGWRTWVRLLVWLLVGFVIYFGYSIKHSKLNRMTQALGASPKSAFQTLADEDETEGNTQDDVLYDENGFENRSQ